MAQPARGERTLLALAAILTGLGLDSPPASASTVVQGTLMQSCYLYNGVNCPGSIFQATIPAAQSLSLDQDISGLNQYWAAAGVGTLFTGDADLVVNTGPGILIHAKANTTSAFSANNVNYNLAPPQSVTFATINLHLTGSDTIRFSSGTLPAGSPVSFQITEVLDSMFTGACEATPDGPSAFAQFQVMTSDMPAVYHSDCGNGSDQMSRTGTFSSAVGNTFPMNFDFQIKNASGWDNAKIGTLVSGSDSHTVDASNTGAVYISVLTPGVTFTSDSGSTYTAAPEPGSFALWCGCCLILSARILRKLTAGR